ncbi:MAG: hypothetical protein S4CHLAM37_03830 [Chlamydiia bacterium]|nr:hypothetical protein [Chlamydiia bacterium]
MRISFIHVLLGVFMQFSLKTTLTYLLCLCSCFSLCANAPATNLNTQNPKEALILDSNDNQSIDDDVQVEQGNSDLKEPPVLYDPQMDYGTGSTPMTKSKKSTKMRSVYAFIASVVIATAGMLISGSNSGRDAPKSSH